MLHSSSNNNNKRGGKICPFAQTFALPLCQYRNHHPARCRHKYAVYHADAYFCYFLVGVLVYYVFAEQVFK